MSHLDNCMRFLVVSWLPFPPYQVHRCAEASVWGHRSPLVTLLCDTYLHPSPPHSMVRVKPKRTSTARALQCASACSRWPLPPPSGPPVFVSVPRMCVSLHSFPWGPARQCSVPGPSFRAQRPSVTTLSKRVLSPALTLTFENEHFHFLRHIKIPPCGNNTYVA